MKTLQITFYQKLKSYEKSILRSIGLLLLASCLSHTGYSQSLEWVKSMGSLGHEEAFSMTVDAAGNTYTTGTFTEPTDFDPGSGTFLLIPEGSFDMFITKLDASGNLVWAKSIGGESVVRPYSIAVDANGNVFTTGHYLATADFDPGLGTFNLTTTSLFTNTFVSKLDALGNFVWAKQFIGTGNQIGKSIAVDAIGNVFTTGSFSGINDFNPDAGVYNLTSAGSSDIFVSKLNASGNFQWAKRIGGASGDGGNSISIDASGNIYTTGFFSETSDFNPNLGVFNLTSAGSTDIFICKLNAFGNFMVAGRMGGASFDEGLSIQIDASGFVYTTGYFSETADFNPGATIFNLTSAGGRDIFVSKLNASGNFQWAKSMGGIGNDQGNSIAVDASGNVYTTGYFSETADFNPGANVYNLTSAGSWDAYVSKFQSSGNFLGAKRMGGIGQDQSRSIAIYNFGNIYTAGYFSGTADFDPDAGIFNLTSAGSTDAFVHKMSKFVVLARLNNETSVSDIKNSGQLKLYPNPTRNILNIETITDSPFEIINILGAVVYSSNTFANEVTKIDVSSWAKGIYILNANGDCTKFIVE